MEIILLERIEKLGQIGDVVSVRPGFARNYLLPEKKALRATKENRASFENQRTQLEAANLERRSEAEAVRKKLDTKTFVIVRQASDNNQLYGSVTVRNISQVITEAGFTIDSKQVQMGSPIKTIGLHPIRIQLHPEVSVTVTVNVARSEEEATIQAEEAADKKSDSTSQESAPSQEAADTRESTEILDN